MIKFTNDKVNELNETILRLASQLDEAVEELKHTKIKIRDEAAVLFGDCKVNARVVTRTYTVVGRVGFHPTHHMVDVEGMENYINIDDVISIEEGSYDIA